MNELQVIKPSIQLEVGKIGFENLEAVKQGLTLIAQNYKGVIVTDDAERYKEAKDQRAEINKIIKAVDDERKRIKKLYEVPLKEFEKSVKDVIAIADEAAKELDSNIKAVEQLRRDKKLEEVNKLITEYSEGYDIQMVDRWLNQTYKTSTIIDDIKSQVYNARQLEAELEAKRDTIRTACKMANFDEAGWLAMFESGADAHDVVNRISSEYDRQQKEAEAKAVEEVAQVEEVPEVQAVEQPQESDDVIVQGIQAAFEAAKKELITYTVNITATQEQHEMLGAYFKSNGITVTEFKL
ncbi:DUF1351 domain-containing protein [Aerococcaceae bacterium NML191219]|nr:DUF1351 domain-containing protein [Aerococcaceae bacterium NML191219]